MCFFSEVRKHGPVFSSKLASRLAYRSRLLVVKIGEGSGGRKGGRVLLPPVAWLQVLERRGGRNGGREGEGRKGAGRREAGERKKLGRCKGKGRMVSLRRGLEAFSCSALGRGGDSCCSRFTCVGGGGHTWGDDVQAVLQTVHVIVLVL